MHGFPVGGLCLCTFATCCGCCDPNHCPGGSVVPWGPGSVLLLNSFVGTKIAVLSARGSALAGPTTGSEVQVKATAGGTRSVWPGGTGHSQEGQGLAWQAEPWIATAGEAETWLQLPAMAAYLLSPWQSPRDLPPTGPQKRDPQVLHPAPWLGLRSWHQPNASEQGAKHGPPPFLP